MSERSDWQCVVCQQPLKDGCWMVNYDNANGCIIAPDAEPAHGQWGMLGIGRDCARQLVAAGKLDKTWILKPARTP